VRVLFGRPGSAPPGATLAPIAPPPTSAQLSPRLKLWCALTFAATVALSLVVCTQRAAFSWSFKLVAASVVLFSLGSLGRSLDGRWFGDRRRV
jgi:hypothetical protein